MFMIVNCSLAKYLMDKIGLPRDTCNHCVYQVDEKTVIYSISLYTRDDYIQHDIQKHMKEVFGIDKKFSYNKGFALCYNLDETTFNEMNTLLKIYGY